MTSIQHVYLYLYNVYLYMYIEMEIKLKKSIRHLAYDSGPSLLFYPLI